MFTENTAWPSEENRITRLLREKQSSGRSILDLTVSNPTHCGFETPPDLLKQFLSPTGLRYDPDPRGLPAAREALARWYNETQNLHVHPDEILFTSGTSEAYSYLFHLLAGPGDPVLIPKPGYPLLDDIGRLHRLAIESYRLRYDGEWRLDEESFRSLSQEPRAIVLIHPNNPTGSFLNDADWQILFDRIPQRSSPLILDEVFSLFPLDGPVPAFHNTDRLIFRLNGLSKTAGLPQLKLAWIVASGPDREKREALRRLEIIADTFLSVNTPVQHALPDLLSAVSARRSLILERVRENYRFLTAALSPNLPLSVLRCEGGWNAVLRFPASRSGEDWCFDFLDRADVLLHPGELFDFPPGAFGVVSLLIHPSVFAEGIRRLTAAGTNTGSRALHE